MAQSQYIIRGGIEGRERLRILSRVMRQATLDLLTRAGLQSGMTCADIACGGGDVACDMALIVGPHGRAVGTDIDEPQLEIARHEAEALGHANITFLCADITRAPPPGEFDLVHARFLLTHLPDPAKALSHMGQALMPGGVIVVEDIDFSGYMCHPESPAVRRYVELYSAAVRARGGDSCIGPRLPSLLCEAGFTDVQMSVAQPAGIEGEVKLISPITMENIAGAVIAEGLATQADIDVLVEELYAFARTPGTLGCLPRVVGAWGRNKR